MWNNSPRRKCSQRAPANAQRAGLCSGVNRRGHSRIRDLPANVQPRFRAA
jgi:hypothetical protein